MVKEGFAVDFMKFSCLADLDHSGKYFGEVRMWVGIWICKYKGISVDGVEMFQ